jgi:hypothetical protein
MSTEIQNSREVQMYGSTKAKIMESIERSITYKFSGIGMIICSYMSDIQEMNERNESGVYTEQIRQALNICKMLMIDNELGFGSNKE